MIPMLMVSPVAPDPPNPTPWPSSMVRPHAARNEGYSAAVAMRSQAELSGDGQEVAPVDPGVEAEGGGVVLGQRAVLDVGIRVPLTVLALEAPVRSVAALAKLLWGQARKHVNPLPWSVASTYPSPAPPAAGDAPGCGPDTPDPKFWAPGSS